jgi:FkbM family methyltransferase
VDIYFDDLLDTYYARRPLTLVDVGARGGLQPNWKPARRHLRLVGFEPAAAEHARLSALADGERTLYIDAAVAQSAGHVVLNVARDGGTSSTLAPNMRFLRRFPRAERFETVEKVTVAADTLDRLLAAHAVRDADFLKLDTQGAELAILRGAAQTLAGAFGVEAEIQLGALYVGQPSIGEIDDTLRSSGFQLFDLRPAYWKRSAGTLYGGPKGQLVFCDSLYFKTEEAFQRQLDAVVDPFERASTLLRAVSICVLYGYLDYAIELFEPNRSLLDAPLADELGRRLRTQVPFSARIPHFRGRGWLSHAFYRLHRAFFPTVDRWASGGRPLGNVD